jgi:hypothetical protein
VHADSDDDIGSFSGKAPDGPLPSLAERIEAAKEDAHRRRVEAGLPAQADDGPFTDEAMKARKGRRKRRPK